MNVQGTLWENMLRSLLFSNFVTRYLFSRQQGVQRVCRWLHFWNKDKQDFISSSLKVMTTLEKPNLCARFMQSPKTFIATVAAQSCCWLGFRYDSELLTIRLNFIRHDVRSKYRNKALLKTSKQTNKRIEALTPAAGSHQPRCHRCV